MLYRMPLSQPASHPKRKQRGYADYRNVTKTNVSLKALLSTISLFLLWGVWFSHIKVSVGPRLDVFLIRPHSWSLHSSCSLVTGRKANEHPNPGGRGVEDTRLHYHFVLQPCSQAHPSSTVPGLILAFWFVKDSFCPFLRIHQKTPRKTKKNPPECYRIQPNQLEKISKWKQGSWFPMAAPVTHMPAGLQTSLPLESGNKGHAGHRAHQEVWDFLSILLSSFTYSEFCLYLSFK